MNQLSTMRRTQIVSCLVEGNSIRSTARMTGACKKTILSLLVRLGRACVRYQDEMLRNLRCKRIQCDEIWTFCYGKSRNLPDNLRYREGYGDVWTWTALCEKSKLIVAWHVGKRNTQDAQQFISELHKRVLGRIQLTSDGHMPYITAVRESFGNKIDFAQLKKIYLPAKYKYNPNMVIGVEKNVISGHPVRSKVSTSFVERHNLTMRMGMRRFTRCTNGFSKKMENLRCAIAIFLMHYNFSRIHQTLKTTPAVAVGISGRPWTLEDIVSLLE